MTYEYRGCTYRDKLVHLSEVEPFDTAIPQDWADRVRDLTGEYPPGHVVWSYARGSLSGFPVAIDMTGARILGTLACRSVTVTH